MPQGYELKTLRTTNHKQPTRLEAIAHPPSPGFASAFPPENLSPELRSAEPTQPLPVRCCHIQKDFGSNKPLTFFICHRLFEEYSSQSREPEEAPPQPPAALSKEKYLLSPSNSLLCRDGGQPPRIRVLALQRHLQLPAS